MAVPDDASGGERFPPVKKSAWTKEEDAVLREQVRLHGAQNWAGISAALPGRNSKSCRLRWCQHLTPYVDDARPFTPEEDARIVEYQRRHPNKWATIAGYLPGRSDNAVKNRWNSALRKQQQLRLAAARRRDYRTLPLLHLVRGVGTSGALEGDGNEEDGESGACLQLFPLALGDLVRGNRASEAAPMDVDSGADDPSLAELRLWPSTTALTMAAFKAMVRAVRAP